MPAILTVGEKSPYLRGIKFRNRTMADDKSYDLTFLNKISGGDDNFILEMITTFKSVAPEYLRKANEYYNSGLIDALSKETHRFIPGVSFLGAKSLEEDLLLVEDFTKRNVNLERLPELLEKIQNKINLLLEDFNHDFH